MTSITEHANYWRDPLFDWTTEDEEAAAAGDARLGGELGPLLKVLDGTTGEEIEASVLDVFTDLHRVYWAIGVIYPGTCKFDLSFLSPAELAGVSE